MRSSTDKGGIMWEYEYSLETSATPETLWRHWADMPAWPQWNDGIETIDVEGPFEVGTTFTMTPPGDEPIRMRLVEIEPGESFTDEMTRAISWCGPSTGSNPRQ